MSHLRTVPALSWQGAVSGSCFGNVKQIVQYFGGTFAFGWALSKPGPFRIRCQSPPPLYRRWVNHVVWRDPIGNLWEVSPSICVGRPNECEFISIEFWEDDTSFKPAPDGTRLLTQVRYVAVRPEGEEVAANLTQAQSSVVHSDKLYWIERAVAELAKAGFSPAGWVMHALGTETASIWLYAD